jgi:acyl-CoA reductase-like NAD-dependent aldehyde dehydrogenase
MNIIYKKKTTPLSALYVAQLMSEAGIPDGVVNVLPGNPIAGKTLAQHSGVDKITFTGSGLAGRDVLRSASENLVPVTLELGGKSPVLVFPDADIDHAVSTMQSGLFLNSGQACNAASRIFVHV